MNNDFSDNLNYILVHLKEDINKIDLLEDKLYFELSKNEIDFYLNKVYLELKDWNKKYTDKNYETIINKYNEIQSIISQLELCLADYENTFHMDGISYSIYKIGKILANLKKE